MLLCITRKCTMNKLGIIPLIVHEEVESAMAGPAQRPLPVSSLLCCCCQVALLSSPWDGPSVIPTSHFQGILLGLGLMSIPSQACLSSHDI